MELNAHIYNLQKFTNYSVEVVAYTRVGEGVRSPIIFVRTQEDREFRNLQAALHAAGGTTFSASFLERPCFIGYNARNIK